MELLLLETLFFIICLCICLFFLQSKQIRPGFKNYPLVGTLPDLIINRHRFLDWTSEVLSSTANNTAEYIQPGIIRGIMTANPLNLEHMLKANFHNFPKGIRFSTLLQDFLGQGIFNVDGEQWIVQRKTSSYEFNTKSLRNFVMESTTVELNTRLIPILQEAVNKNKVLDIQDMLERFAFDNINRIAFNVDPNCLGSNADENEFMQAFEVAATLSSGRFMYALPFMYRIKKFLNVGTEKRLQKSIKIVHEFADKIIRTRLEERAEKKDEDLLSRFMGVNNNNNKQYSPIFLRDIVISFILAGRDTTSSALTWFFWILSSRKDVKQKILEELHKIRLKNGKNTRETTYNFDELKEMNYLHAAISEAMRLYPPVPVDTKACLKDDILPDGTLVKKDWFITYHTYAMARMVNIWGEDCCEYKPERWFDQHGTYKQESPFRFPVFNAGPRMCLGKDMAYIQMKSIVASVIERFEFDVLLEKDKRPEYLLSLTLRMKGGLPVKVTERFVKKDWP